MKVCQIFTAQARGKAPSPRRRGEGAEASWPVTTRRVAFMISPFRSAGLIE
jgi:hypothetical protein